MINYELLNYLKSSTDRNWLRYYGAEPSSKKSEQPACLSKELYTQTQAKIDTISRAISQNPAKIAILIVESNPLEFIAAFLAGVITEVDLFLANPDWQESEWRQVLDLVVPDLILGDERSRSQIAELASTRESLLPKRQKFRARSHIMVPTGGTSGKIKFAVHTWETLSASVSGFKSFFDCQKINSVCTLPLYHVSGLMQLMRSLLTQGSLILCGYKSVAEELVEDTAQYFISLVPTQLQYLIELNSHCLKKFKTVLVGGAPPPQLLLNRARTERIPLALTYGMTETASGIVALKPTEFMAGNNSNGRVLPHAEVKLSRQTASNRISEKSEVSNNGLITIRSTSLCLGYYPQLLSPTRPLITDDLGYFDAAGYLYIVGRDSQKIITGGENVFPGEVEQAIYATNLVKDVCVIGILDRKWGQAVTAVYVAKKDISNSLKQQMRSRLAKYKQPKHWIQIDRIPRNNRGKVNYRELKAIVLQIVEQDLDFVSAKTKTKSKPTK